MLPILVRRYNDIDHMAPLIWRLVREGRQDVAVLAVDLMYDLEADFRLTYLRDELGVRTEHVFGRREGGWFASRLGRFVVAGIRRGERGDGGWTARTARRICASRLMERTFDRAWAQRLLRGLGAKTLVLDWHRPRHPVVVHLLDAAHGLGLRSIAVPHGGLVPLDKDYRVDPPDYGADWQKLDTIVLQNEVVTDMVCHYGVDRGKVRIIGSCRFCRDWTEIMAQLMARHPWSGPATGLKVLYLDHSGKYNLEAARINSCLKRIHEMEGVILIVKGSTSADGRGSEQPEKGSSVLEDDALAFAQDVPTSKLVAWADIVVGTTSSALFDALVQEKLLVIPKHFHSNTTVFEKHGCCVAVETDEDLLALIAQARQGLGPLPYGPETVASFRRDHLCGGEAGRDVLGAYCALIAEEEERAVSALPDGAPFAGREV